MVEKLDGTRRKVFIGAVLKVDEILYRRLGVCEELYRSALADIDTRRNLDLIVKDEWKIETASTPVEAIENIVGRHI